MKNLSKLDLYKKKYIIFDMDGTLIDSIGVWNSTDQRLILKYAKEYIDEIFIQTQRDYFLNTNTNGNSYFEYAKFLIKLYNLDVNVYTLTNERATIASKILKKELDYKPRAVELIYKLKNMGFTLALATMTSTNQLDIYAYENPKMSKRMNLYDTFDYISTIEDVKEKKPNPEIYLKIMEQLNANNDECLVFEDSYTGVLAANNANIDVVNVYDRYADVNRDLIDKLTDYKINNYDEFISYVNYKQKIKKI